MISIIDKAVWQIDAGVFESDVVSHFRIVFEWLHKNKLLSVEGEEEYEDGIDDTASLNEKLLTNEGLEFLEKYYDEYLEILSREDKYGKDCESIVLSELYQTYLDKHKC